MDPQDTLLNGQPVPREVKELATGEDGVNTAVVAFLHPSYRRVSEADTLIRAAEPLPSDIPTEVED